MIVSIRAKKRDGDSDLFFQMGVHYCSVGLKKEPWRVTCLREAPISRHIATSPSLDPSVDFVPRHIATSLTQLTFLRIRNYVHATECQWHYRGRVEHGGGYSRRLLLS